MQIATSERTRLFVDGVPRPITADVTNRRGDGLVVTQALPFLRLATSVTGTDGRRSRISRVTIAMDGDVPKLLLELLHDEEPRLGADAVGVTDDVPPNATRATDEDTIETWTPGVSSRPARTDGTVPYELQVDDRPSREVPVGLAATSGAAHETVTEPPPRLPAAALPLWLRLWHGVGRLWSALVRRPLPALTRG